MRIQLLTLSCVWVFGLLAQAENPGMKELLASSNKAQQMKAKNAGGGQNGMNNNDKKYEEEGIWDLLNSFKKGTPQSKKNAGGGQNGMNNNDKKYEEKGIWDLLNSFKKGTPQSKVAKSGLEEAKDVSLNTKSGAAAAKHGAKNVKSRNQNAEAGSKMETNFEERREENMETIARSLEEILAANSKEAQRIEEQLPHMYGPGPLGHLRREMARMKQQLSDNNEALLSRGRRLAKTMELMHDQYLDQENAVDMSQLTRNDKLRYSVSIFPETGREAETYLFYDCVVEQRSSDVKYYSISFPLIRNSGGSNDGIVDNEYIYYIPRRTVSRQDVHFERISRDYTDILECAYAAHNLSAVMFTYDSRDCYVSYEEFCPVKHEHTCQDEEAEPVYYSTVFSGEQAEDCTTTPPPPTTTLPTTTAPPTTTACPPEVCGTTMSSDIRNEEELFI